MTVTLDRNKIYHIGKLDNLVTVKIIDKITEKTLETFLVNKAIRRKTKLILYCESGKLTLNFKNIQYAKSYKKTFKKLLKNEHS